MISLQTLHFVCEHLEKYVFDRVWNEPYSEYRSHIKPIILNPSRNVKDAPGLNGRDTVYIPSAGVFIYGKTQVQLPVANTYRKNRSFFVYSIPSSFFRSVRLNVRNEWVKLSDYCTENCLDMTFFTDDGIVIWRNGVYIRQSDTDSRVFIAVDALNFKTCAGDSYDPTKVMLAKYYDSDLKADNKISCYSIDNKPTFNPIPSDATIAFYNGKVVSGEDYFSQMRLNGLLEVVKDEDVIAKIVVPISNDDTFIYKGKDDADRILVHIPKSVNVKNELITRNTCDFYLVPTKMKNVGKNTPSPSISGVHITLAGNEEHFHQLTHSDFSLDYDWVESIAESNGFAEYELWCLVRTHDKDKTIVRDAAYIDLLYTHTDEQIVDILCRRYTHVEEHGIDFWNAAYLEDTEKNPYADALIKRRGTFPEPKDQCAQCGLRDKCTIRQSPEFSGDTDLKVTQKHCPYFTRRGIKDYIDILGYHHVLALIAKRVTHFRVDAEKPYRLDKATGKDVVQLTITIPLALCDLKSTDIFPVVYHNGRRIPQEHIEITDTQSTTSAGISEITFTDNSKFGTDVVTQVYSSHARITIKDYEDKIKQNDVLAVEIFDSIGDHEFTVGRPRIFTAKRPETYYRKTTDAAFEVSKYYYVRDNATDTYTKAPGAYPGSPIPVGSVYFEQIEELNGDWHQEVKTEHVRVFHRKGGKFQQIIFDWYYFVTQDVYYAVGKDYFTYDKNTGKYTQLIPGQDYEIGDLIEDEVFNRMSPLEDLRATTGQLMLHIQKGLFDKNEELLFVEGPTIFEDNQEFDIHEEFTGFADAEVIAHYRDLNKEPEQYQITVPRLGTNNIARGILGEGIFTKEDDLSSQLPLDSAIVFLNNNSLVHNLDYRLDGYDKRPGEELDPAELYVQNVSYVTEHDNVISTIRSQVSLINAYAGFMIGDDIMVWGGEDPYFFEGLSMIAIDGIVCSHFVSTLGAIKVTDTDNHRNGAPFEIRTMVSTRALELLEDYRRDGSEEDTTGDLYRLECLKDYFSIHSAVPEYRSFVEYSHKIYSIYLEKIFSDLMNDTGKSIAQLIPTGKSDEQLIAYYQGKYKDLYDKDIVFQNIRPSDLKYVDLYMSYHRFRVNDREEYALLARLARVLLPEDLIKHKDAINV